MADSNIEIYTLMIKRFVQATRNLDSGLDAIAAFYIEHGLAAKLNEPSNLPDGFIKADYDTAIQLHGEIKTWLGVNYDFGIKFHSFDGEGILDPLDLLGRKYWYDGPDYETTEDP